MVLDVLPHLHYVDRLWHPAGVVLVTRFCVEECCGTWFDRDRSSGGGVVEDGSQECWDDCAMRKTLSSWRFSWAHKEWPLL